MNINIWQLALTYTRAMVWNKSVEETIKNLEVGGVIKLATHPETKDFIMNPVLVPKPSSEVWLSKGWSDFG